MNVETLLEIKADLQSHKRDRKDVLIEAMQIRLDKSLDLYRQQIQEAERVLMDQDELKILKKLRN